MQPTPLTPPNRSALWSSLALTTTQLAALCGVTTRQVGHWTLKGYLATSGQRPDRYSGEAIDLCVLVKQGLDQGLPLRRAVGQARTFLANDQHHRPALAAIEPLALAEIRNRLQEAHDALDAVLQAVEPLVPRQARKATPTESDTEQASR